MIKIILVGVGLFGAGTATGYFIGRKILEERYQCDVKEMRDLYQEKLAELEDMIQAINPSEEPEDEEDDDEDEEPDEEDSDYDQQAMEALAVYRGERRRSVIEYNKPNLDTFKSAMKEAFHSEGAPDPDDDDEESDDPEYDAQLEAEAEAFARRQTENMQSDRPYLIEPEDYHDGPEDYDHQILYYYAQDRTLCEDDDDEVEDEEECVGFDYEDKLDMQTTCWVRNDVLRVLYEIHRIDDSYKKAVQGVSETPREREFRIQGRRKQALDQRPSSRSH